MRMADCGEELRGLLGEEVSGVLGGSGMECARDDLLFNRGWGAASAQQAF
jgi:hypothetical protein